MADGYLAVSDGTFTLTETDNKNQFYFYRNDEGVIGDVGRKPMDMYQTYIMQKMMMGDITDMVMSNVHTEISEDGKCLRLTVTDINKELSQKRNSNAKKQQPNIFKRLFNKIFG